MALNPIHYAALKADIAANTNTVSYAGATTQIKDLPNDNGGNDAIAQWYNANASPSFTVWKSNVTLRSVGDNINGTELAGLTSLNITRLQAILQLSIEGINPALADRRAFFDDVFSGAGGATTRAQLLALWKRLARRIEKLLATGTGSDASPATLGHEGAINYTDVANARLS